MDKPPDESTVAISRLAVASLVVACFSVLLSFIAGIPAIILAVIALYRIRRRPDQLAGIGYAHVAMCIAFLCSLVFPFFVLMADYLNRAQLSHANTGCAANIKGIMTSMAVYANENNDRFPIGPPPRELFSYNANLGLNTGTTDAAKALAYMQSTPLAGNVTSPFWILVLTQQVSPKSFLCRSDPFVMDPASPKDADGKLFAAPQTASQLSYSISYPWQRNGSTGAIETVPAWCNINDATLPVMSDMAPLNGTGKPARDVTAVPSQSRSIVKYLFYGSANVSIANPHAHRGEGLNIGFADTHSEWVRRSNTGQNKDNIFTSGGMPGKAPRPGEVEPITTASSPWDTVMVPLRDGDTGKIR